MLPSFRILVRSQESAIYRTPGMQSTLQFSAKLTWRGLSFSTQVLPLCRKTSLSSDFNLSRLLEVEKAEVYIREHRKPTIEELMKRLHSIPRDHSKMDPSMHMESLKPDKNKLTQNTIKLQNKGDSFSGSIPTEWRSIRVIVIYGNEQSYYLTKNIKL